MVINFEKKYLSELYNNGRCNDKKHRYQPEVIAKYVRRIVTLAKAPSIEALYSINALNYEVLMGQKQGISSVRIDKQFRLEFTVTADPSGEPILTVCTIIDITNHYK